MYLQVSNTVLLRRPRRRQSQGRLFLTTQRLRRARQAPHCLYRTQSHRLPASDPLLLPHLLFLTRPGGNQEEGSHAQGQAQGSVHGRGPDRHGAGGLEE